MTEELKTKINSLLPDHEEEIKKCIEAEKEAEERAKKLDLSEIFWDYGDCRVNPQTLNKLFQEGVLELPFGTSGSPKKYCLVDKETTQEVLEEYEPSEQEPEPASEIEVDLSVFSKVIEVREMDKKIKKVMARAAEKPGIHVALIGKPGTGKSLIASCIEDATRSSWISGTDMTKASVRDELIKTKPRFVVIDELDKYSSKEPVQLLSEPMEDQTLTVQTSGKEVERMNMPINVFATGNELNFPSNIEDRFLVLRLPEYSDDEFHELITTGFPRNEGIDEEIAQAVADKAVKEGVKSYRRCRAVAKMCNEPGEVDWIFNTFEFKK